MSLHTFVQIVNALETSADILLSEQLIDSTMAASQEVTGLLSDCTDFERLIIIDVAKTIKARLLEYRTALKRIDK